MSFFMVAASHSPLLDFPARESEAVVAVRAALEAAGARPWQIDRSLPVLLDALARTADAP